MTRERRGFSSDAFHQVAVGDNRVNVVIDQVEVFFVELRGEVGRAHRHADAVCESLAQRAGGDLDAGRESVFRMARCF
jgi:hypothetical protein